MDPYNDVYGDGLQQLARLKTTSPNSLDFNNIKTELIEIIADLENALVSVKQSKQRAASGNGNDSFAEIDSFELQERERKLEDMKKQFNDIMASADLKGHYSDNPFADTNAIPVEPEPAQGPAQPADYTGYHQQLLQEQDELISNGLATSIENLHRQAATIGDELNAQGELLDGVQEDMDRLNFKVVNTGIKRMNKFLESNKRGGDCCIAVLIVVLIILLVVLVIV